MDAGGDFVPNQQAIPAFAIDAGAPVEPPTAYSGYATAAGGFHLQLGESPISPGTVIGTFKVLPDGGVSADNTQSPVDTTVPDLARRKQLAAVLDVVHAVTALDSRPVFKCPDDVYSHFDEQ